MCIAAIIHEPISAEYLESMEHDNPHGGGVAWAEEGRVEFRRGLTAKDIIALQPRITLPYLLHFRWATHGGVCNQLTHPFPIGPRAMFGELSGAAPAVLIHNGVWSGYTKYLSLIEAAQAQVNATSDTGVAAYLVGMYPSLTSEILGAMPWATALGKIIDGKFVVDKFGHSWTNYGANEYSNLSWLPAKEWFAANKQRWSIDDRRQAAYGYTSNGYRSTSEGYSGSYSAHNHYSKGWDWEQRDPWEASDYTPYGTCELPYPKDGGFKTPKDEPKNKSNDEPKDNSSIGYDEWMANKDVEPFVDDYLTTRSKERKDGAREVIKCFDGWEDYVRWRYGDEIANEIHDDEGDSGDDADVSTLELTDNIDLVSDEGAIVNAFLAKQQAMKQQKKAS